MKTVTPKSIPIMEIDKHNLLLREDDSWEAVSRPPVEEPHVCKNPRLISKNDLQILKNKKKWKIGIKKKAPVLVGIIKVLLRVLDLTHSLFTSEKSFHAVYEKGSPSSVCVCERTEKAGENDWIYDEKEMYLGENGCFFYFKI